MKHKVLTLVAIMTLVRLIGCNTQPENEKHMKDDPTLTLINPFVVPEDKLEETIKMWEQARDFLQQQPGYISTALHLSITPEAKYRLINVAKWESEEAFRAATQKMRAEANIPRIDGVQGGPELYSVIRRD